MDLFVVGISEICGCLLIVPAMYVSVSAGFMVISGLFLSCFKAKRWEDDRLGLLNLLRGCQSISDLTDRQKASKGPMPISLESQVDGF